MLKYYVASGLSVSDLVVTLNKAAENRHEVISVTDSNARGFTVILKSES